MNMKINKVKNNDCHTF